MSEAVTVPRLMIMTSTVSEESLGIDRHRQTGTQTGTASSMFTFSKSEKTLKTKSLYYRLCLFSRLWIWYQYYVLLDFFLHMDEWVKESNVLDMCVAFEYTNHMMWPGGAKTWIFTILTDEYIYCNQRQLIQNDLYPHLVKKKFHVTMMISYSLHDFFFYWLLSL